SKTDTRLHFEIRRMRRLRELQRALRKGRGSLCIALLQVKSGKGRQRSGLVGPRTRFARECERAFVVANALRHVAEKCMRLCDVSKRYRLEMHGADVVRLFELALRVLEPAARIASRHPGRCKLA